MICAYRENEIEQQPELKRTIEWWQQSFKAEVLHLKSLEKDNTEHFVADSLRMKCSEIKELTCIIQEKTGGNIFFIRQFLMFLQNKGMLYLHSEKSEVFEYKWYWDIEAIRSQCPTENVIDIVLENLKLMPKEELDIIEIAACIGNCFDIDILTFVSDVGNNRIKSVLFNFWKAGMITYDVKEAFFSHDRIHQAIYSMVSDDKLPKIHLKIGKGMLEALSTDVQEERIFNIVFHWNQGVSEIRSSVDIIMIAKLNLQSARKAKENSAYIEAKNYTQKALNFLPMIRVKENYKLALEIYNEMSEITLLLGEHKESYAYTKGAMSTAETIEEKFEAFQVRVRIKIAESRLREAVDIACEYVELLGEKVERNVSFSEMNDTLGELKNKLGVRHIEKITELPEMTSYRHLTAIRMLTNVLICSYMISPILQAQIVVTMIELSLKYGNTLEATVAWVYYALTFELEYGNLENGYNIGKTAIDAEAKFGNEGVRARFSFNLVLAHRKQPMREILKSYLEIHEKGLKIGDLEYSCQGLVQYGNVAFHAGCELTELEKELTEMLSIVKGYQQKTGYNRLSITLQVIMNLRQSNKPSVLCGRIFDEFNMVSTFKELEDTAAIFIWATQNRTYKNTILVKEERKAKI